MHSKTRETASRLAWGLGREISQGTTPDLLRETWDSRRRRAQRLFDLLGHDSAEGRELAASFPAVFVINPVCGCGYRVTDDRCCRNAA